MVSLCDLDVFLRGLCGSGFSKSCPQSVAKLSPHHFPPKPFGLPTPVHGSHFTAAMYPS